MYNGIGLSTVRGSATSGHVSKNLSYVKPDFFRSKVSSNQSSSGGFGGDHKFGVKFQTNSVVLEHNKKHALEAEVFELEETLKDEGKTAAEIEERVRALRAEQERRSNQLVSSSRGGSVGEYYRRGNARSSTNSHEISARKETENSRFRAAFGLSDNFKEGDSFDPAAQERRREERTAEKERVFEERRKQKEQWEQRQQQREKDKERREAEQREREKKRLERQSGGNERRKRQRQSLPEEDGEQRASDDDGKKRRRPESSTRRTRNRSRSRSRQRSAARDRSRIPTKPRKDEKEEKERQQARRTRWGQKPDTEPQEQAQLLPKKAEETAVVDGNDDKVEAVNTASIRGNKSADESNSSTALSKRDKAVEKKRSRSGSRSRSASSASSSSNSSSESDSSRSSSNSRSSKSSTSSGSGSSKSRSDKSNARKGRK